MLSEGAPTLARSKFDLDGAELVVDSLVVAGHQALGGGGTARCRV